MATGPSWRPAAGEIPTTPGVYRFSDQTGRVLYVGKAKNLRQRLSSYFAAPHTLHERTRRMVGSAANVQWTVVGTDVEALQLEYTWIKELDPPFNVKFRDDKSYPYLVVTLGDEAPRVTVSRNRRIRGARYFGPYPKIWAVRETIDLMITAFPIRTCTDASYKRAMQTGRPCFAGQIGRCGGPCSGTVTIEEHRRRVDDFVAFLAGNDRRFVTAAQTEMREAAAAQDYERAAACRDRLQALESVLAKSAVVLSDGIDADLFAVEHTELSAAVQQFVVRGGRIRGERSWTLDTELDMTAADIVRSALQRVYDGKSGTDVPKEILVPAVPDDVDDLAELLSEQRRFGRVRIVAPKRGERAALMQTATLNAKHTLARASAKRSADFTARSDALAELQEALGMTEAPLRMECFDVSHLGGTNVVASMVVFEDGLARKDQYRRFAIQETTDDTDSIHQVLSRRLARLGDDEDDQGEDGAPVDPTEDGVVVSAERSKRRFAYPPQLLIVDGGAPQVQAAWRALQEVGRTDIALCGIAKRLEELWVPNDDYPVVLARGSEALFLVQRIRDEAHRFAIAYQRQKRKKDIRTVLAEVDGLGPARIKALLGHFGSVSRLRQASVEEIGQVDGVGRATAAAVAARLGR